MFLRFAAWASVFEKSGLGAAGLKVALEFRVQGLGFGVLGSGFRVLGLGFWVGRLGFRVWGSGCSGKAQLLF